MRLLSHEKMIVVTLLICKRDIGPDVRDEDHGIFYYYNFLHLFYCYVKSVFLIIILLLNENLF